jgi:transposase
MKSIPASSAVYLWQGVVDMRMSFDRLAALVNEKLGRSVISGGFYLFFSRCRSRVKILYWDSDGYALWHKRLETGLYRVARVDEHEEITGIDLERLLSGTEFSRIKLSKNAEKGSFNTGDYATP